MSIVDIKNRKLTQLQSNISIDLVEILLLETKVTVAMLATGYPIIINIRIPKEKETLLNLLALKYGFEVVNKYQLTLPLSYP